MKCFYHRDIDAVGTCKSCGKGLCADCAIDLSKGLACRGRCEADVRALIELVDQNIKITPLSTRMIEQGGSARLGLAVFFLLTGSVFAGWGLTHEGLGFASILGVCFFGMGLFQLFQALRLRWAAKRSDTQPGV